MEPAWASGSRGVLQDVTPATLDAVAWLARGLRGPVTLDVNLALGDPYNALALARAARRRLPRGSLDTLEIGNEPDLYTRGRVFHVPGHVHRRVRKRVRYGADAYRRDVTPYLDVLSRAVRGPPRAWRWPASRGRGGGRCFPGWCGRPAAGSARSAPISTPCRAAAAGRRRSHGC